MKRRMLKFCLLSLFSVSAVACGFFGLDSLDENTEAVYKNSDGLALSGYDAVAYFKDDAPREGKPEFNTDWNGAKWQFSSAENRDEFKKNPQKYAPQYGGYCAYAVSQGYTASTDPKAWTIVEDKLYLNYSESVREKWTQDIPQNIADADKHWKDLSSKTE